jgi:oligopeptidase A
MQQLRDFAQREYAIETLQAWDIAYNSEKLKLRLFDINEETLKPYFPVEQVIKGLFELVERLYGIRIKQRENVDIW